MATIVRSSRKDGVFRDAVLSADHLYRYALSRAWGPNWMGNHAVFIGLNPSTADWEHDDPTIRRCMGFARMWGFDGLLMLNLFAYRATDPAALVVVNDPVGPDNDGMLRETCRGKSTVVACWGTHGAFRGRGMEVKGMLKGLHVLRLTQQGFPAHPLYLPKFLTPIAWKEAGAHDQ